MYFPCRKEFNACEDFKYLIQIATETFQPWRMRYTTQRLLCFKLNHNWFSKVQIETW